MRFWKYIGPGVVALSTLSATAFAQGATVDPMTFMPASTQIYMNVNLDAGRKFLDQMKDTHLGKDIQSAVQQTVKSDKQADQTTRMAKALLGMLEGFGTQVGIGIDLPPDVLYGETPPQIMMVVPVQDATKVQTEVKMITGLADASTPAGVKWREETEGADTIHVLVRKKAAGKPDFAWALSPGALVLGTGAEMVRSALKSAGNADASLLHSPLMTTVGAAFDRSQFLSGFIGKIDWMGTQPKRAGMPDFSKMPTMKLMSDLRQASAFGLNLAPDRIDGQLIGYYDPNSPLAAKLKEWEGAPMKAPALSYGDTFMFEDISNVDQLKFLYTNVYKPMFQEMMQAAAGKKGDDGTNAMFQMGLTAVDNVVEAMTGEAAIAVSGKDQKIPSGMVLWTRDPAGKLQPAIQSILDMVSQYAGQKWYSTTVAGTPARIFGDNKMSVRPILAAVGDFVVLALDRKSLVTPIFLAKGVNPGHSLAANPEYQGFQKLMPNDPEMVMFLNFRSFASWINQLGGLGEHTSHRAKKLDAKAERDLALEHVAWDLVNETNIMGFGSYPDPAGTRAKMLFTFDPNRVPPPMPD